MKRILAILLTVLLFIPAVSAYTDQQLNTADALHHLGLFLGNDVDYDLDGRLSRAEGITLLVRMIGKEARAKAISYTAPFTDVPDWAKPYVNYAFMHKITNGISDTEFAPDSPMTDCMFLTLVLRVLGYKDSGEAAQFRWDNPYALAASLGLISVSVPNQDFCRGEAVTVFWNALLLDEESLAHLLMENEVFTAEDFLKAADIQKNGISKETDTPVLPPDPPDSDSTEEDSWTIPFWPPYIPGGDPEPDPPEPPAAEPEKPVPPAPSDPPPSADVCSYETYMHMTTSEQSAFEETFLSSKEFYAWLKTAKQEYEEKQNYIEIGGDGSVDLGDLMSGND